MSDTTPAPRQYLGVMVSSTFTDLVKHRAALMGAISREDLVPVVMENSPPKADLDLIDSSLQMVRDAAAYVAIISRKYGQTPECPYRNPDKLSITELEFNEALRLGRHILLFLMDPSHPVPEADMEFDSTKRTKLEAFRQRAKLMTPNSKVHRIHATFDSLVDFEKRTPHAISELRRSLDRSAPSPVSTPPLPVPPQIKPIPIPPAFHAEPPYIGSHTFVGRQAELGRLSDWAAAANPHPVLLFEAIGGSGKSMLTWEWATNHAPAARPDWAGRFWYSFYEKGAVMAGFCQHALAYITRQKLETFQKRPTAELAAELLAHLQARPWLFILDGLERVLVSYHRIDAAQVLDEEAGQSDQIGDRNPCAAIRPEDDDLLRLLGTAKPSKLLLTSRLTPKILLNAANQPTPGVLREILPGLRPADAEELFKACGVHGTSATIQAFLQQNCDCHPLVIGVLAGLVNRPGPHRGRFDAWVDDPAGGRALNLANLDLIQKRNHILRAALDAVPAPGRQLLSTLALVSAAVDYETLAAFNPHLPPEPEAVAVPSKPEDRAIWRIMSEQKKEQAQTEYQAALQRRQDYEQALAAYQQSAEVRAAPQALAETVADLEQRGLLQYDQAGRYDLHPVVRGIASGGLQKTEEEQFGQKVLDYFSTRPHNPYVQAETLDDVQDGLQVVRMLLRLGRYDAAATAFMGDLALALVYNLEAAVEGIAILQPFFGPGWGALPAELSPRQRSHLMVNAAIALYSLGETRTARDMFGQTLLLNMREEHWHGVRADLANLSAALSNEGEHAAAWRLKVQVCELAGILQDEDELFVANMKLVRALSLRGEWRAAEAIWQDLARAPRPTNRGVYIQGDAETEYAWFQFYQGSLTEADLHAAEQLAGSNRNRFMIRALNRLRGEWRVVQQDWQSASASLREAVQMARAVKQSDAPAETMLARTRFHLGELTDPRQEAAQLAQARNVSHLYLAQLWLAIGDREQAAKHARTAYEHAWADGEPYVHRYDLIQATKLLQDLRAEIPQLPAYDPANEEKFPWEDELIAGMEKLRAEKAAEAQKKTQNAAGKK